MTLGAYRLVQGTLRLCVRAFFRRVEVEGLGNVPRTGGGLLVSWHPNGLVDPGLILTHAPRQVVFGARDGLFRYPLLGTILREIGTVPIYRAIDRGPGSDEARRAANKKSLDALAAEIAKGSFSALFPEGVSHDEPFLHELKTGAARLYYRARQLQPPGAAPPVILLVGLHYDDKQMFRSNAFVAFHHPLAIPADLDVTPSGDLESPAARELARKLTDRIEIELREVVHATEDWDLYDLLHRTRRLIRAERASRADADPGRTSIGERVLGFARVRAGYYAALARDPERVAALRERVETYDADMRAMGLVDYELDRDPKVAPKWIALLVALQSLGVFLLLPPLVAVGYLVNVPTALLLVAIARLSAGKRKDEATIKLLLGSILYPLTWIAAGIVAGVAHDELHATYPRVPDVPVTAGITFAVLSAIGGASALRYWRVARETGHAVRVRLTRRRYRLSVARLRRERSRLHDELLAVVVGVALPGEVATDGRVRPTA